jgi:hypothetical protein
MRVATYDLPNVTDYPPQADVGAAGGETGQPRIGCRTTKQSAAAEPAAGNVSTQALTMERAMPQRTAETRRVAPEPMMAEVITWVVDTGAW